MSENKSHHGGRALLNLPGHHSTAAIVAEIEDTSLWQEGYGREGKKIRKQLSWILEPDVRVSIADCDRTINLIMEMEDEDKYANSLHKIDTIIAVLKDFRKGLVVEHSRYIKRIKHSKEMGNFEESED